MSKSSSKRRGDRVLDATELVVLAGIFARSNMGQGFPSKRDVEAMKNHVDWRTKKPAAPALETVVSSFCDRFMETDEHYDWFMEEARGWLRDLRKEETVETVANTWPDIAELYWRDPATYQDRKEWPNG